MTVNEVVDMYGNWSTFVKKTGFGRMSWFAWRKKGYVPIKSQYKLEQITNGVLKADFRDVPL